MSFVLIGILNSQAAGGALYDYWMASMGYGGRYYGIENAEDGNVIASGVNFDGTNNTAILTKFDINGQVLWHKEFAASASLEWAGIATDGTNFYAAGTNNDSESQGVVMKFDTNGAEIWSKAIEEADARINNVFYNPVDNEVVCVGSLTANGAGGSGDPDAALVLLDPANGNVTANRMMGREYSESAKGWAYSPTGQNSMVLGNILNGGYRNCAYFSEAEGLNYRTKNYYYATSIGNSGGYMESGGFDYNDRMYFTGRSSNQSGMTFFRSVNTRASIFNTGPRNLGFDSHAGKKMLFNSARNVAYVAGDTDLYKIPVDVATGVNPTDTFLRTFSTTYLYSTALDEANNAIWVVGKVNNAEEPFIARIPLDGSLTGFSCTLAGQTVSYDSGTVYYTSESTSNSQSPIYNTNSNVNDQGITKTYQDAIQTITLEGIEE